MGWVKMSKTIRPPMGAHEKFPEASRVLEQLLKGEKTEHICKRFKKPSKDINMTICDRCDETCMFSGVILK